MSDLKEIAENARQEMIAAGVDGWPNVVLWQQERIEQLERENEALIESIKKREPWFGAWMPDDVYKRLNALREQGGRDE